MKFSKLFGFITAFDINRDKGKNQNPGIPFWWRFLTDVGDEIYWWQIEYLVTDLSIFAAEILYIST